MSDAAIDTVDGAPTRALTPHFPCFDGLRALAAASVFLTHASFISGLNVRSNLGPFFARGDVGVAIFFLVSGFLLYRPFVAARFVGARRLPVRPYLRRRFLRIFPAYWFALTMVLYVVPRPLVAGRQPANPSVGGTVLHYLLLHTYHPRHVLGPLQQAWTLAIELSFYLFLPLYAWFIGRRAASDSSVQYRRELTGLGLLYATSVVVRIGVIASGTKYNGMINTWLPTQLDYFSLGMGMAVVSVWHGEGGRRAKQGLTTLFEHRAAPLVSWALAFASFYLVSYRIGLPPGPTAEVKDFGPYQQLLRQFLYGSTAFFLLLPAVFGPQDRGLIRRFLQLRAVVWIGLISYGIYLWHEAMMDWYLSLTNARVFAISFGPITTFAVLTTLLVSATSYILIEKPALRLKNRPLRPARTGHSASREAR